MSAKGASVSKEVTNIIRQAAGRGQFINSRSTSNFHWIHSSDKQKQFFNDKVCLLTNKLSERLYKWYITTPGLSSARVITMAKNQLATQLKKDKNKRPLKENEEHNIKGAEMKDLRAVFKNWSTFQENNHNLL